MTEQRLFGDLNPRQRAFVRFVVERCAEQRAAKEEPGVLVRDITQRYKNQAPDVVRHAFRRLITLGFIASKKQTAAMRTTFTDSGIRTQKLLVYLPGPLAPKKFPLNARPARKRRRL